MHTTAIPTTLPLPILPPREAWPVLIESAAAVLEGRSEANPEAVATQLRLIAGAMGVRS